jgi:hypothetical protein
VLPGGKGAELDSNPIYYYYYYYYHHHHHRRNITAGCRKKINLKEKKHGKESVGSENVTKSAKPSSKRHNFHTCSIFSA